MSRSARLLDLLQALRGHRRPVSAARLAALTGVSPRTLYRDIATLVAQGAPIRGAAGLGYVLEPGYLLPPLMFSAEEADAVVLGLRLVGRRADPALAAAALAALAKIEAVLPAALGEEARGSGLLAGPTGAPASPHLATVRTAMREERRLALSYGDEAGRLTERIVWPVAVGFFRDADLVAAWCESRQDFRHFRIDRIRAARLEAGQFGKRRRMLLAAWRSAQGLRES